jgi:hypothetical protein
MKRIDHDNEFYGKLNCRYIGQQERLTGYSLDLFLDLQTGSHFVRAPGEGIFQALERVRKQFEED